MGRVDIYPTASLQGPPTGLLGYAEITSNQTGITTEVDITGLTVTVTVPAGRRIRVSCYLQPFTTVAADTFLARIYQDATQVQQALVGLPLTATGYSLSTSVELTPSAGTHTYKITGFRNNGSGSLSVFSAANTPSFIMVEDITGLPQGIVTPRILRTVLDGGGSAITTGAKKVYITVPSACTIIKVRLLADVSGSIVLDVWRDSFANYPPTVADTITASAKPTLSSAIKSEDSTLTGWSTVLGAGDVLEVNVDSASTVTKVYMDLFVV